MSRITPAWVDATGEAADRVIVAQGDGTAAWGNVPTSDIARTLPLNFAFFDSAKPYLEYNTTTPTTAICLIYPGTAYYTPDALKIIGDRSSAAGQSNLRVYDFTNDAVIATVTWTPLGQAIYSTNTFNNLPAGEAIWELQVWSSGGGGAGKSRILFVTLE